MTRPRDFNDILAKLPDAKKSGDEWKASCPCAGHKTPQGHLSLKDAGDRAKAYCHPSSKHSIKEICQALGFGSLIYSKDGSDAKTRKPEIEAIYKYSSAEGIPWKVVRTRPKGFFQRKSDGKGGYINNIKGLTPLLYHQDDDMTKAIAAGDIIWIVEGENDADNLRNKFGLITTTNPMGAGKWRDTYSDALFGADLVIIPDNDEPGRQHVLKVASSCYGIAKRIRILELPQEFKDISDWLEAGHTREEFDSLLNQANYYNPNITIKEGQDIENLANMAFPDIAWQGYFKDYRDLVGETTEASDIFHYAAFCQVLGLTLARRLYVYHAKQLYPNFYIVLIGRTGLTRKDSCLSRAADILNRLHDISWRSEENRTFGIITGIRSWEGLLDQLEGESRVRLIFLSEFISLLTKAKQESLGNIIPGLTELYDCPEIINPPVHVKKEIIARRPFVSIISATTQAWMQKHLSEYDIHGGFANRWLYIYGVPKGPKPNPPKVDDKKRNELVKGLNTIRSWADSVQGGEITISQDAQKLFAEYYEEYWERLQPEGLVPSLIQRIQEFIWKLALLYAAMNLQDTIKVEHLEPAIAIGNFLEDSVTEVFRNYLESAGKQRETRVLEYVKRIKRKTGEPVDYREVYKNLNMSARELDQCIEPLTKLGLIQNSYRRGPTGKQTRRLEVA